MKRVMVTGINGFVGKHLAHELKLIDLEVIGVANEAELDSSLEASVAEYYQCDLTRQPELVKLPFTKVDSVINLAGLASVGDSFGKEREYQKVNVDIVTLIGNQLLKLQLPVRLLAISSGAVYDPAQNMPLTEKSRVITKGSPYAMSKVMMEGQATALRAQGLDCVIVRPFNHIGPGQKTGFLLPDLFQKIKDLRPDVASLVVGDLSTKRDFTDVRDVVRAYCALINTPRLQNSIYNVCSGTSVSGEAVLKILLSEMGIDSSVNWQVDQKLLRPADPKDLYGNSTRLHTETGWQPKIALTQTIHDYVLSQTK